MTQRWPRRIRNNTLSRCDKAPLHPMRPYARLPLNNSRDFTHSLRVRRRSVIWWGWEHGKTVIGRRRSWVELRIWWGAEGHALGLKVTIKGDGHYRGVGRGGLGLEERTCVGGEWYWLFIIFYRGVVTSRGSLLGGSRGAGREGGRVS